MKYIKTKSKEEFLQHEFKVYYKNLFEDYKDYFNVMGDNVDNCKNCGCCYWKELNKICKCKF